MKYAFWLAVCGLVLNSTVWGLSWMPFRGLAEGGLHPLWATAIIYAAGTIAVITARPHALREFQGAPMLFVLALASGFANALFNSAVAIGDVVRVVLLFYLMPIWAVLLARWMLGEPLTLRAFGRIALGLAGAMLVLYEPAIGLPLPRSPADWLAIAGGMAFALNNVALRRSGTSSAAALTLAMMGGGTALAATAAALLAAFGAIAWPGLSAPGTHITLALWALLFLAANLGLQYGAARLPANLTAVIMLVEVLVATGSSWLAGAAQLNLQDIAGGALIIAAPFVFADRSAPAPATGAPAPRHP